MNIRFIATISAFAAICGPLSAQSRRATFVGGGSSDRGKCTIEVVVDGAADVEIRGDQANLRNLSGTPAQWRRFECTGPLPSNPVDFRFAGVDGRGRQELIRDPRQGGSAVVRIEDRDGGREGYTFDLFWANAGGYPSGGIYPDRGGVYPDRGRDYDGYYRERDDYFRGNGWRRNLFERVRQDLDHVQSHSFADRRDAYRFDQTRQQLDELQSLLSAGRYDERELNDVINALGRVVRDNRLVPRDRDLLNDDLNRLRDFRSRAGDYGARRY